MITFYSGTPGSGKSFHMAKDIRFKLLMGRNVICSENINTNKISKNGKKHIGHFVHKPLEEMSPEYFYRYAYEKHTKGKEHQTTIIMDECHRIFNPREYGRKDRKDWLVFFSEHRHIGYDIIMVSQNDRQIDRQIRSQFEHEIKHRKFNNMFMLGFMFPTMFICIERYYGNNLIIQKNVMFYKKRIANIYDSYAKFDDFIKRMEKDVIKTKDIKHLYTYDEIKKDLYRMKYGKDKGIAVKYGKELAKYYRVASNAILVPVPMHPEKEAERGFNQANVIAEEISKYHDVKIEHLLEKHVKGIDTAQLTVDERRIIVNKMYRIASDAVVKDKIIILIDDVVTSGMTLNVCKNLLTEAGAKEVNILVIARTPKNDEDPKNITTLKTHGVHNNEGAEAADAAATTNEPTTNRVTEQEKPQAPTPDGEADTQMGAGGPHQGGRFTVGDWWLKGIFTAGIKGSEGRKAE